MRVLIAEDEAIIAGAIAEQVEALGHTVLGVVRNSSEGRRLIREGHPDVLLLDVDLEDGPTGPLLADRRVCGSAEVLFLTGHDHVVVGEGQLERDVLCKPFAVRDLADWIEGVGLRRAA